MEIMAKFQELMELGKSDADKQKIVNVAEVWHLWDHLVSRYDVIEATNILKNFARDPDLKVILNVGADVLIEQVKILETLMLEYGIPLPNKPPESANSTLNVEIITDQAIFRNIFFGIQSILPTQVSAFLQSTSPKIRDTFARFAEAEIDLYDKFLEYGKAKGWTVVPPAYRA